MMWMGMVQALNHSLIYLSGRPAMSCFKFIVIAWDNSYMLCKCPLRHFYIQTNLLLMLRYTERRESSQNRHIELLRLHSI